MNLSLSSSADPEEISIKRSTRVSFRENLEEHIEPTSISNDPSRDEQTCMKTLNNWWRSISQRMTGINHENTDESKQLFPFKSPYRTIKITDKTSVSLTCNDRYLLIKQAPNLCLLDKQLLIVKEIPWTYDHVDMCWSSTLNQFILITAKAIFTLDENSSTYNPCSIENIEEKEWSCGTCSETSLYLSTNDLSASLYQYTLPPNIQFIKEWHLFGFYPKYEGILTFTYAHDKLAFIISNIHFVQRRFDVRCSKTLERLWSIRLDAVAHCCSINTNQWLIMELLNPRLLHISSDGKILQQYRIKTPSMNIIWNATQWDKETIVTFTMTNLNLHKLEE